jgi:hypothetical protein
MHGQGIRGGRWMAATTLGVVAMAVAGPAGAQSPSAPIALGWTTRAPAPTARIEMATAVLGDRVYLVGGLTGEGVTVTTMEVHDPVTDTWAPGPDYPAPVHHAMAAVVGGTLYVAGGYDADWHATRGVHRLGDQGWEPVARLPMARAAGAMVALDGRLYLAGGIDVRGDVARAMQVYDPATDTWATADGPPTPREHLGGAVVDGRFVTVGGRVYGAQVGAAEAFDPLTGSWEQLPELPTPRAGLGVTRTCDGGLVAIGGEDIRGVADRVFAEVEAWHPSAGVWERLPDLPVARHGLGVASVGSTVLALGGGPAAAMSTSDLVDALDLAGRPGC